MNPTTTDKVLARITEMRRLAEKATPDWCSGVPQEGRLFAAGYGAEIAHFHDVGFRKEANTRFAIAARTDLPECLDLLEALIAEREACGVYEEYGYTGARILRLDKAKEAANTALARFAGEETK